MCVHAVCLQLCPTLCDPMNRSPPVSSVHGVLQARILEWVAMLPARGLPDPEIEPESLISPALTSGFLLLVPPGTPPKQHTSWIKLNIRGFHCRASSSPATIWNFNAELYRVLSLLIFVESVSTVVRVYDYMYAEIPPQLKDYTFQKYMWRYVCR